MITKCEKRNRLCKGRSSSIRVPSDVPNDGKREDSVKCCSIGFCCLVLVIVQSMLCSRCDEFDSQAGHNVSQHGYYKMPEETAKAFILHPDGKIWFHTGDIGVM